MHSPRTRRPTVLDHAEIRPWEHQRPSQRTSLTHVLSGTNFTTVFAAFNATWNQRCRTCKSASNSGLYSSTNDIREKWNLSKL